LELCGRESFDDGHRSAALGTAPQRVRDRSGRGVGFFGGVAWRATKQRGSKAVAASVGEEAEVANANKTLGEQVKQEATEELIARQSHQLLSIVGGRVPPAKGNLAVEGVNKTV